MSSKKTVPKMRRIDACIPFKNYEKIQQLCREKGITFSDMIRRLLEKALEEHKD